MRAGKGAATFFAFARRVAAPRPPGRAAPPNMKTMILLQSAFLAWACGPAAIPEDLFERSVLPNGIELLVVHVPEAERQSTLSFLPWGLRHDGAGRAQFAHLVEHVLIRSHDPDLLELEGIEFNGETTGGATRLDTYARPEHWRAALELHATWLGVRSCDPAMLEREKARIVGEERGTVGAGATGKWALAAWSQAVLHGLDHAAVHGDVAAVAAEEVEAYLAERVLLGPGCRVVTVGPASPDDVRAAAAEAFADLPVPGDAEPPALDADPFAFGDGAITWDLRASNYLEWYPLPSATVGDRLAGLVLSQRLAMLLMTSDSELLGGGRSYPEVTELLPGRFGLLIHVQRDEAEDVAAIRAALSEVLPRAVEPAAGLPRLETSIANVGLELSSAPPWERIRSQLASRGMAHLAEAQVVLSRANLEIVTGLTGPRAVEAAERLTPERVREIAATWLTPERRSSLAIGPRPEGESDQ